MAFPIYEAVLPTPWAMLGARSNGQHLTSLDWLPQSTPEHLPTNSLTAALAEQLQRYLNDPHRPFNLPLQAQGTPFQQRVWAALSAIPVGQTRTYGELAKALETSPRAIGQACGNNPLPLLIPCHRVVGKHSLGGFMLGNTTFAAAIKIGLLNHEQR